MVHARAAIEAEATAFLHRAGLHVAAAVRGLGKAGADDEKDPAELAAEAVDYEPLRAAVAPKLKAVASDGARAGFEQVGGVLDQLLSQANERAVAWAQERAAELVKQLDETTRQAVRDLVQRAEAEGWSNDDLAAAIAEDGAFGAGRAERIARTETAFADVAGNLAGWEASGVVQAKRWIVADANECDLCADLDGVTVPLDEEFPDEGGDGPPLHPNCRCDVLPVLADADESDDG